MRVTGQSPGSLPASSRAVKSENLGSQGRGARVTEAISWRIDSTHPKKPETCCGSTSMAVRFQCGGADRNPWLAGALRRRGEPPFAESAISSNWGEYERPVDSPEASGAKGFGGFPEDTLPKCRHRARLGRATRGTSSRESALRFRPASACRAPGQIGQALHAQALGHFPQPGSRGREEPPQQPPAGQLPQPRLPVLRAAAQTLEDHAQLRRDQRLSFAKEPTGVVHQEQVVAQRESLEHPFTRRIEPPSILDRTEP